jgi:hypothetical protein
VWCDEGDKHTWHMFRRTEAILDELNVGRFQK